MQLTPYQECHSAYGWWPIRIPSSSEDRLYTVLVSPWAPHESICECKGYIYRGRCHHQDDAWTKVCRWSELKCQLQQSPEERKNRICPGCGGNTHWEVEVSDDI